MILAGGESRRMGTDKAFVEIAGRTMLDWVAAALAPVCEEVVVVGDIDGATTLPNIADPGAPHRGPLAGLVAAMHHVPDQWLALVAVDQPWLRAETARRLGALAAALAAVPVDAGIRQTTCAVYPPTLVSTAEAELAGGGSLQSLLDVASFRPVVDWASWGEDGRSWFSVDTPADLKEGLRRFGEPA